jgi:hypothetical protein
MHEDEWRCVEKECKEAVKMNMSYKMHCVLRIKCINNKRTLVIKCIVYWKSIWIWSCTWDSFCSFVETASPCAHTISVESTLALNLRYCGARVVYVNTLGTLPPQCKAIHDSLSVLPKLEKSQETRNNVLHMANYCPTLSLYPTHASALCSQGHSETLGTYINGAQALKVGQ